MVLRVGTVCSGIEAPIQAMKQINVPFKHVYACECDEHCQKIIESKYKPEKMYEDLWAMADMEDLPTCDILIAGLPCQAFSSIGNQEGFNDRRGLLYLPLMKIMRKTNPKYVIFENVQNVLKHNDGNTFWVIEQSFDAIGYKMKHQVLMSSDYGVPQLRKRVYVVCYRENDPDGKAYQFPEPIPLKRSLSDILGGKTEREYAFTLRVGGRCSPINDRHNWDGYIVDGKEMRIGPREASILQGFPEDFYNGVDIKDEQAMKQMGNTMTVDVVREVIRKLQFKRHELSELEFLCRKDKCNCQ